MITYRQTQSGDWVVSGPSREVTTGEVKVTKKDGQVKIETVVDLGKERDVDGVPHRYGYLTKPGEKPPEALASTKQMQFIESLLDQLARGSHFSSTTESVAHAVRDYESRIAKAKKNHNGSLTKKEAHDFIDELLVSIDDLA